jgi:hypothetical protein
MRGNMNLIKLIQIIRSVPISKDNIIDLTPCDCIVHMGINLKKAKDIAEAIVNRMDEWR